MFKKCTVILALLTFCLMTSVAFAGIMSFPKFKINVPDGWEASQDGSTVILVATNKSASLSITVDSTQGTSLKDMATSFSAELKGSTPTLDKVSGGYHFTFKSGTIESDAIITIDDTGKEYVLIVLTGENPQVNGILDSIEDK